MSPQDDLLHAASARLAEAHTVVVLTGAGISAESGIRTFRDTMDGLWKDFDPEKLATPGAFAADPELVTRWYDWRRQGCLAADPNPGHVALGEMQDWLESRARRLILLTQNVDGLHQRAGSRDVVELHGSIHVWRCTLTAREVHPPPAPFEIFPPRSEHGGLLRPGIVWFGEALPPAAILAARRAVASCDLFMSIGTSAVVFPAAGFVQDAGANGAITIEVNRDPTPISRRVDISIRANAVKAIPGILRAAKDLAG